MARWRRWWRANFAAAFEPASAGMSPHYSAARIRRGVLHFLVGKVGSALLSFCGFLLVARLLQPVDYGRYVTLIALVELGMNLASLGLDWVSTRYVPAYRVKGGGQALSRFVVQLVGAQALALSTAAGLLALAAPWLAGLLAMGDVVPALRLYALYLLAEGLCRVVRDQMLAQLLLQGRAQLALLLRHLVWVGLALALWMDQRAASLWAVAVLELVAALIGLLAASAGLGLALRQAVRERGGAAADWQAPAMPELRHLAANSYLGLLLNLPARPQVITLLVTRLAGLEAAALYGFARSLADQVLRFLPAELLLGFLRPAMVARHVQSGRFDELNQQTNTLLVVSLLVLAPLLALVIGRGDLVVQVLGAGRFTGSGALLALMLLAAALFSHRRMLEFVANTVGRPQAISRASVLLLAVPVVVVALLGAGWPVWTVPATALLFECLFGWVATRLLRHGGVAYEPPLGAAARMALLVLAVAGSLSVLPVELQPGWAAVVCGALALAGTALLAWLLCPLDVPSRDLLRTMLKKKG